MREKARLTNQHGMTGKRNAARAKKPSVERVEFRCTEAEKVKIERLARKAGVKVSDYCRAMALQTNPTMSGG